MKRWIGEGWILAARCVRFQGNVLHPTVGEIEDTISPSGMTVCVELDDDSGVTIGVHLQSMRFNSWEM